MIKLVHDDLTVERRECGDFLQRQSQSLLALISLTSDQ